MLVDAISHLKKTHPTVSPDHVVFRHLLSSFLSYLPGDREVVLPLAAGSDDQVSLVQGLHHFLRLVETDIVEVGMGDHTLYICCRDRGKAQSYKGRGVDVNVVG